MKNNSIKDPLGHVKLAVSDFKVSKEFYQYLFNNLKFRKVSDNEKSAGWVTKEGFGIWVAQAETLLPKYKFSAPGLHHLCIRVSSKEEVDAIYNLIKDKVYIFDKPQKYPEYTDNYYAVFFSDPDGIKLEIAYY